MKHDLKHDPSNNVEYTRRKFTVFLSLVTQANVPQDLEIPLFPSLNMLLQYCYNWVCSSFIPRLTSENIPAG